MEEWEGLKVGKGERLMVGGRAMVKVGKRWKGYGGNGEGLGVVTGARDGKSRKG